MTRLDPPESPHFHIEKLADGVYGALATRTGAATSNAGIVDLGETTLVFDTFLTPKAGADLARAAEALTGRAASVVVNSHYHYDHIRGNQHFPHAQIVATNTTYDLVLTKGAAALKDDRENAAKELELFETGKVTRDRDFDFIKARLRETVESLEGLVIKPPTLTFGEELGIRGSGRTARLLTYGGGHSGSDAFLYLPRERIAFMGDLLLVGYHPWLADGNPEELVRILERAGQLDMARAVPGHGPLGTVRDLAVNRKYVQELTRLAKEAVRSGRTKEQAAQVPVTSEFDSWNSVRFFSSNMRFLHARVAEKEQRA